MGPSVQSATHQVQQDVSVDASHKGLEAGRSPRVVSSAVVSWCGSKTVIVGFGELGRTTPEHGE